MGDRFTAAVDNLTAAIAVLKDADRLRAVHNRLLSPAAEPQTPVAAVVPSRLRRDGATWTGEVLLQVLAAPDGAATGRIVELMARVDGCVTTLIDSESPGGVFDRPVWDFWPHRKADGSWAMVGCMATLRVRIEDPLLTET